MVIVLFSRPKSGIMNDMKSISQFFRGVTSQKKNDFRIMAPIHFIFCRPTTIQLNGQFIIFRFDVSLQN